MEFEVVGGSTKVVFGAKGLDEIYQNVRIILTTVKGSVPGDREFGLSQTFLDQPTSLTKTRALPEIIEAVEKYETRAQVSIVNWVESNLVEGQMIPRVQIKVVDNAA